MWANNGDAISLVYAGTGATTSSVTRNGDKSNFTSALDHGLKTITRFYINNFQDDYTQEIIDFLLGNVRLENFLIFRKNVLMRAPTCTQLDLMKLIENWTSNLK